VSDLIEILGLRGFGRHGVFAAERSEGQQFIVDVALSLDVRRAAATDLLSDTVDYGALGEGIVAIVEGDPVDLIETLAQAIADLCLIQPLVDAVTVRVHKPEAPLRVPFDDVVVTITRTR
jgi:dihydroneopterin aldolase